MGLSRQQRKQLQEALIDAFPTKASLEQMMLFELDKNLEVIAVEGNLQKIVFKIIQTAEAEAWVEKLIGAAHRENPGNPKLQAISKSKSEFSSRDNVQKLLLKQVSTEVESRISNSLHNRIYIVQDTDQNPSQIELPWGSEIKVGSKPKVHLTNTEITTIYDQPDIAGRLLILGEPGVGKTTMLLKLAEELVNRANNASEYSIPVLFSLSSWKNDSHSIKEWLVDQLKDKYGVRKDIGKQLVDNQEIIPLLDGLDELAAERQEKCVVKINEFLHPSNWTNPVVICSRIEEYQRYQTLLQLNNSLELRPLTSQQVEQYLHDTDNLNLWDSISQNEDLKQLTQIPLFLNIIVISGISIPTWQQFQSFEERLSYLFDAYIKRMFGRGYPGKQPKQENTLRWLGWLAERLIEENKTELYIEKMQPSWLKKGSEGKINRLIYGLIFGLIVGLIFGLIFGLIVGLIYGLIVGLIYGLIFGLIYGLIVGLIFVLIFGLIFGLIGWFNNLKEIKTYETIDLAWNLKTFSKIGTKLIFGLILGLILGLFGELIGGLIFGLIFGLIYGLDSLKGAEVENKIYPNYGIKKNINYMLISIIISTLLLVPLAYTIFKLNVEGKEASVGLCLIFPTLFGVISIGEPVIYHFCLRLVLWLRGYVPWNYAKFLDYCTNRLFLQRVGGGYRFMHDLLRQHFANSYAKSKNALD
jgi:GTPase SAR1 family protein/MFS family permease